MDVLQKLRDKRLLSELASRLKPAISRQAVRSWRRVPYRYLRQVASLTGIHPAAIRPDRATQIGHWPRPWAPPTTRGELDLRYLTEPGGE
jgi:hypothetical protein